MHIDKHKKLQAKGWQVGDAVDFLNLSEEEAAYLEVKMSLSRSLKNFRAHKGWSQAHLATAIGSSQSRVAKMEAGDRSVSVDLLIKTLLSVGASTGDLAEAISAAGNATAFKTDKTRRKKHRTSKKNSAA